MGDGASSREGATVIDDAEAIRYFRDLTVQALTLARRTLTDPVEAAAAWDAMDDAEQRATFYALASTLARLLRDRGMSWDDVAADTEVVDMDDVLATVMARFG